MTQPQYTIPATVTQWTVEDRTWPQDMAGGLGTNTASNVTAQLLDNTGAAVELEDGPVINGTVNQQRIRAGVLDPTRSPYLLVTTYSPTGSTDVLAVATRIVCPVVGSYA